MTPPATLNVVFKKGFTAQTTDTDTLWRPKAVLEGLGQIGTLQRYDEKAQYQNNENCTRAVYKVKHYAYPVVVWFDNTTGERIA